MTVELLDIGRSATIACFPVVKQKLVLVAGKVIDTKTTHYGIFGVE